MYGHMHDTRRIYELVNDKSVRPIKSSVSDNLLSIKNSEIKLPKPYWSWQETH